MEASDFVVNLLFCELTIGRILKAHSLQHVNKAEERRVFSFSSTSSSFYLFLFLQSAIKFIAHPEVGYRSASV